MDPIQHLRCLTGGGWSLDIRLIVSLRAALVPEAKSKRPATGLATVPRRPLPTPVMKPCTQVGEGKRGRMTEEREKGTKNERKINSRTRKKDDRKECRYDRVGECKSRKNTHTLGHHFSNKEENIDKMYLVRG